MCKYQVAIDYRLGGALGTDKHTHTHFLFYITDLQKVQRKLVFVILEYSERVEFRIFEYFE